MNTPSLKQLIAGFLLIAAAVTSSMLFLSVESPRGGRSDTAENTNERTGPPANAFIETPDGRERPKEQPQTVPNVFPESAAVSDNLTDGLVALLGEKIADQNPDGPKNPDGTLNLSDLDTEELADYFAENAGSAADIPDWEAEINRQHITVLTKYTTEDINAYNKQVNQLLEFYGAPAARLQGSLVPDTASLATLPFAEAHRRGTQIIVPEPVAGFHWSLMKLIAYQRKAAETAKLAETDPVRAALILQAQETNYFSAIQLLVNESQRKTDIRGISAEELPFLAALVHQALGIQTAHAQWLVIDPADIARMVWEYLKKIATELLKDRLVHRLVQQTIKWVQGGGKPQFVTNFKGFLTNVAEDEAGRMIEKFTPRLCQSFGPLVRVAVIPVDPARDLDAGPTCTLDQVVGNVRAFAQSFENGGWVAYGAAMQPSNNFFGAMIQMSDIVDMESAKQKEAKKTDVESSSGFLSSKECIQWTSEYDQCVESLGGTTGGLKCSDAMSKEPNICVKERNTTPGETLVGAIKDSSAAPLLRIVNADDLAALANALINAALSKLVKLGASTVSKGLLGLDMGNYEEAADKCAGLTGEQLAACQKQWQDVNCTETTVSAPVNVGVTVDTPPACITDPDTGIETCGGGGPASGTGSGTINFPNGADCTGGPTDPGGGGGGGGGDACTIERCGAGCYCENQDGLTGGDFCAYGAVQAAIQAAKAAPGPGGGCSSSGLIDNASCGWLWCVCNESAFTAFITGQIPGSFVAGDEVSVPVDCGTSVCSRTSCPANQGQCIGTTARYENYKLVTSFGALQGPGQNGQPKAICPR